VPRTARRFPAWLAWLGLVVGVLVAAGGIFGAAAEGATGSTHDIGGALTELLEARPIAPVY
jgi:hypothetical protein